MINCLRRIIKKYYVVTIVNYTAIFFYFCYPLLKYSESPFHQSNTNDFIYSLPISEFAIIPGKVNSPQKTNGNETSVENIKYVQISLNDFDLKSHLKYFNYQIVKTDYHKLNFVFNQIISRAPPSNIFSV
ncbi:MAG: hypothetical protein IPM32_17255 [Ignavibacteriae bacterium]|nr:hypothetical protein [Ignavibacteriota bacterium]